MDTNATPPGAAAAPAPVPAGVALTDRAAGHVQRYIAKRGKGVGLRLGVRTTGCSGLAYKLEFADEVNPEDHRFESNGVTVLIDPKSLAYLEGTELDYVKEGLNEGFKFNNPNEKDRCGCGESFNV
jgi:iron-sulfur cluster assembly protein